MNTFNIIFYQMKLSDNIEDLISNVRQERSVTLFQHYEPELIRWSYLHFNYTI